jgi:hypothetical protein
MAKTLETRRERIRRLIAIATEDGNHIKQAQGYYLLNMVNRRLSEAYSLENRFTNLY